MKVDEATLRRTISKNIAAYRKAHKDTQAGLAEKLNLRITPELTFVADSSAANGAHIASLLEDISREAAAHEPENPGANESEE